MNINDITDEHLLSMSTEEITKILYGGPEIAKSRMEPQPPQPRFGQSPLEAAYSGRYNAQTLTGHQLAGLKAGLSPDTPGLEKMSFAEMKDLAQKQAKEAISPTTNAHARLYCEATRPHKRW